MEGPLDWQAGPLGLQVLKSPPHHATARAKIGCSQQRVLGLGLGDGHGARAEELQNQATHFLFFEGLVSEIQTAAGVTSLPFAS